MKHDEVLQALREARAQTDAALAGLGETELVDPGVIADWSVKDVLAHLTAWEAEMVTLLAKAKRGQKPKWPATQSETDALNAKWHKENKNRPLDRVRADFQGVRQQTVRQVEGLSDQELNQKWDWLRNRTALDLIASNSFRHELEHVAQIKEWRKKKLG
jgi:uncharacterized protein (TIGR03083 family)